MGFFQFMISHKGLWFAPAIVLTCFLTSCGIRSLSQQGIYKEISPDQFALYLKDSLVNIVDVRTPAEFKKSHIENAINVSYFAGHFMKNFSNLNLDTAQTVLIYCETQHRSLFVARKIARAGFKTIIDLDKGMAQWRKKGLPYIGETRP